MKNKQMPSKEVLQQFGYSEEELSEYLSMLEDVQNCSSNCKHVKKCSNTDVINLCNNKIKQHKECNCSEQCSHEVYGHNHCDCDDNCNNQDCDCGDQCGCNNKDCTSEHHCNCDDISCNCHDSTVSKPKLVKMCVLEEGVRCCNCGACNMCDLNPSKVCDNCGKCLDTLNTDEKGFVYVPVDKIITGDGDDELQALLAAYGLDGDDEDNQD